MPFWSAKGWGGGGRRGAGGAVLYPHKHFRVHWYLARSCTRTPRKIHCFVMEFGIFKIKRDFCLTVIQTVRNNHKLLLIICCISLAFRSLPPCCSKTIFIFPVGYQNTNNPFWCLCKTHGCRILSDPVSAEEIGLHSQGNVFLIS